MGKARYSRYYNYIDPLVTNPIVKSSAPPIFNLITVIIFLVFVIRPTVTTIFELQKEISEKQKILEGLNQKADSLTSGKRNLELIDPEKRKKIGEAVPQEVNVVSIIQSLNQSAGLAASSSASPSASVATLQLQPVTIINNNNQKAGLNLEEVLFSYNLQKPYNQLLNTLNNNIKTPRLINSEGLTINRQGDDVPTLTINGKAYFLK
jgi:ABC-type Na+ efflux pump permease subunit